MTPLKSHLRFHRCFVVWPWPGGNENTCGETSTVQDWSREADSNGFSGTNWLDAAHANHMACESSAPKACFKKYASQYSCSSSKHFNPTFWLRQSASDRHFGIFRQPTTTPDDHIQPQQPQFSRPRAQVLHLMVAAVIGWRTSPWIGSSHWSPMSRRSVPTEMTHRLTMIPERIGDLGPHEDRDPNQLWHPGILTGPSSWSENCSKKSSGNSSKRDYIIILNILDKSSSTLSPENHTLSRSSGKTKHPRLNGICRSQIMSHFRRSVVPLWGLVFLVSSLEDQI